LPSTDLYREGSFPWIVTYTDDLDSSIVTEEVYSVRITNKNETISTSDPDTCDYNIFPRLFPKDNIYFRTRISSYDSVNELIYVGALTYYRLTDPYSQTYSTIAQVASYLALNLSGQM
jgi:hypothetical protein